MGFGPAYVAHIPPLEGWYSRDSLCYGVGACVAYITAKSKYKKQNQWAAVVFEFCSWFVVRGSVFCFCFVGVLVGLFVLGGACAPPAL